MYGMKMSVFNKQPYYSQPNKHSKNINQLSNIVIIYMHSYLVYKKKSLIY